MRVQGREYQIAVKALLSIVMVLLFFFTKRNGSALLYSFYHVNVFHLAGNLVCLWLIRGRMELLPSYVIAVISALLPQFTTPVYGFSGVLFSLVGLRYGKYSNFLTMFKKCGWVLGLTIFIPNVAVLLHAYCLVLGYVYGYGARYISLSRGKCA